MAKNYKIVANGVGEWRKGAVVSEKHITEAEALGGVQRLLDLNAVEETDEDVQVDLLVGGIQPPELTKGDNVDPGSDDDVHKRAKRREDAVGKGNTGMPSKGAGGAGENLNDLTVEQLKDRARDAGVEGFSTMHKDELVKSVRAAERRAAK